MINNMFKTKIEYSNNTEFVDRIDEIRKEYLHDLNRLRRKYLVKFQKEFRKHSIDIN